jgi:putative transposase
MCYNIGATQKEYCQNSFRCYTVIEALLDIPFVSQQIGNLSKSAFLMLVRKSLKYRIYPDQEQQAALAVQFGHARFVYNMALTHRKAYYAECGKGLSYYDTCYMLTVIKKFVPWLREASNAVLQQSLKDLDQAFRNFFEGQAEYPKFKNKSHQQSIRYPEPKKFKVKGSRIHLPKVGNVRAVFHRPIKGKLKSCTVSKTPSGKYFVSILCEVESQDPIQKSGIVGIDLGLKHFAVLSTGEKIDHPQYFRKSERRLARLNRRLSRTKKGSKGREKARLVLTRQYERIANQRKDFLHKLSRRIVNEFGYIKIENLNVCGMMQNHSLAKSISDSGWGMFGNFLGYKSTWAGGLTEKIDRFFASSKTCHVCLLVNQELKLHHRFWTCAGCLAEHDRDENAAINIELWSERPKVKAGGQPIGLVETGNLSPLGFG